MLQTKYIAAVLLLASASSTLHDDTCAGLDPWEAALEDWATADRGNHTRHGRIMSLAPSQGYYVTDRVDLVPPPPPRPHPPHSMLHRGPYPMPQNSHHGPPPHKSGHHGGQTHPQQSNAAGHSSQSGPAENYNRGPSNPSQQSGNTYQQTGNPNQQPGNAYQQNGNPIHQAGNAYQQTGNPSQQQNTYQPSSQAPHSNGALTTGGSNYNPPSGPQGAQGSMPYDEWQATPPPPPETGKIVNRPPNPYKDQFKPSYDSIRNEVLPLPDTFHGGFDLPDALKLHKMKPPQAPPQSIPVSADRVDAPANPPQKQVSETDLYLLRAIEKLVYRVDLMEKRMRKMEENMHYIVAGNEPKPEPCESNFTRVGAQCYHFSSDAVNWKSASYACRKLKANLLELDNDERKQFVAGLQSNKKHNGADFWTGGLNPGLLWIWSHSATAVVTNGTKSAAATIVGEGRCLALVSAPATREYVYRGQDCALRHRYVCEKDEDNSKLSNEIERVAKSMRDKRKPKIAWESWDAGKL